MHAGGGGAGTVMKPPAITADEALVRDGLRGIGRSFYGGAVENLENAPMGKGHGNEGRAFDIETACYHKPVLAEYDNAIREGHRLKLVLKAGVKTMKSFIGEVCCAEHTCNRSGDAAIFFGTENTADVGATTRILDFFRGNDLLGGGIPRFRAKMETLQSRFDDTKGALKFPDKTLFILSANLANTQQKNLAFVLLQDAFLTGNSGMIKEMIARTTQYQNECIIFIESQGGEKDFNFDMEYEDTDQRELHVICPCCGTSHLWNWKAFDEQSMTRPDSDEFRPVPPLVIPSLDHEAWIQHHQPLLKGKVAGFQRGDEQLIKFENGEYNEAAILAHTHFECYHCGGIWRDDGEFGPTRIGLDKSSHYIAARPQALLYNVGFNIPQWINRRLPWGPMMLEKLKAQKIAARLGPGHFTDLRQWWQKTAARTWDESALQERRQRNQNAYDVGMAKHDAWRLCMIVDNQMDLMVQWVMVLAAKRDGTVRQIWRGPLHGLVEVRKKQMEYKDDKGNLLLKDQFVFLDGRYKPDEICRHIVEKRYGHWATMEGERVWLAWMILQGSPYFEFTHEAERDRTKKFLVGDPKWREYQVDGNYVEILFYPFSATQCGQRFESDRDGTGVETLFLERQPGEAADDHPLSHHSMIFSNKLVAAKTLLEPRMSRQYYKPFPASAPDHYFHMWRMWEAVKELWLIDGVSVGKG